MKKQKKQKKKMPKGKFYSVSRKIHWISSAICLAGILFFTVTGITLNHANLFEADATNELAEIELAAEDILRFQQVQAVDRISLALEIAKNYADLSSPKTIEDDVDEIFMDFPHPGGYTTLTLNLEDYFMEVETSSNGFIALINDLHKGRHANLIWIAFIDICSVIILLFCLSGLILLYQHAPKRGSTWPLTGLGILLPFILAITMYI